MELTIQVNPVDRTVRLREVRALAAGDSCSVVLEGVRGADVSALRLALYRDAASDSPVASCPSFALVRGHPNLATGDLRLDTTEMAAWFEAVRPEPEGSGSGDAAERAVRTDGWLVVSEPTRTWSACRVPVILRPGAGVSGVVDPTSIQSLIEGLVSAAMSEALASKADKATTLAGYGITDAATKSELDSVNQNAANAFFVVQSELSTKADLVDGKVPANQLPSYVDDVLEYGSVSAFPATGEDGKIYVAKDTNKTYRWGGTQYVEISPSLALGETAETAYPGDKGKAATEKANAAYSAAESLADGVNSLAGTIGTHIRDANNPHKVTAAQVGALPISGGTLTGGLAVGEEHTASRKLTVAAENGANGITLQGGVPGTGSSITIGGSDGIGGTLTVSGGAVGGGKITVKAADQGNNGGSIEVTGPGASIKKDGKEVATETYVDEQVSSVSGELANLAVTVNAKADKASVYTKAESDARISAVSNRAEEAYSAAEDMVDAVNSLAGTIGTHIRDANNPHKVTAEQVGAVQLVVDSYGVNTAVTIGSRSGIVGPYSLANGANATASGNFSHAEGRETTASGVFSHAEGYSTTASVNGSHAEGNGTIASGNCSHAEGRVTVASGNYSHADGFMSQTLEYDDYAYSWNGDGTRAFPYTSHGAGTYNVNPVGGSDGFYIGEKKLSEVISDGVSDKADKTSLAPEYSPSSAYSVGAFVYHDGNIYQCTTAIADGGEEWNAAHWEMRKLDDFFTNSNSLLTGTIDARIPYPLNAVTDETGLLKDRAINTTSLASVTVPDNFTDLLVRASVASSLSVTMPESIATKYGDTFPGEAGEYLITITKTGAAEAYVRTIKLEVANA